MRTLKRVILALALAGLVIGDLTAQSSTSPPPLKLMEFGDTNADNEMAYLDVLAKALNDSPESMSYIVAYSVAGLSPGDLLMRVYGYRDYLLNKRGIDSSRVVIAPGGARDKVSTELWLVPRGAVPPKPNPEFQLIPRLPLMFASASPDCPPEMTVYLYELEDSLKFYAEALQANPSTRAKIVVYSGRGKDSRKVGRTARKAKAILITHLRRTYSMLELEACQCFSNTSQRCFSF